MIDVDNLTDKAVFSLLSQICDGLLRSVESRTLDADHARCLAEGLIDDLDCLSEDDGLGTEGWEHFLGVQL